MKDKTVSAIEHSPTPWEIAEFDGEPCIVDNEGHQLFTVPMGFSGESGAWSLYDGIGAAKDAAFIVRAVKVHEDMIDLLYWILGNSKGSSEQATRIVDTLAKAEEE